MIENWKDTAFGSDFGGDFLELIERISDEAISMELIFEHTDLKKYLDDPSLLKDRTDNNVNFTNNTFPQYVHFEDLIIALSAVVVEGYLSGTIDLAKAYGNKTLKFRSSKNETLPVYLALQKIYEQPDKYVLFEMLLEEERKQTLNDINEILTRFEQIQK